MKITNNSTKDIMNETYCQESNCTINSINNYHNNNNDYDYEEDDDDYVESDYDSSYDTTNKYHDAGFPDDYDWM